MITPGDWKAVRSLTCGHLRASHNYQADPRAEWTDDDIRLIDAAPALLAACEKVIAYLLRFGPSHLACQAFETERKLLHEIEAAVRKATDTGGKP